MNIVIFVNPLLRNWLGNDWVEGGMGLVSPNIKIFVNLELQGSDKFILTFFAHISGDTYNPVHIYKQRFRDESGLVGRKSNFTSNL